MVSVSVFIAVFAFHSSFTIFFLCASFTILYKCTSFLIFFHPFSSSFILSHLLSTSSSLSYFFLFLAPSILSKLLPYFLNSFSFSQFLPFFPKLCFIYFILSHSSPSIFHIFHPSSILTQNFLNFLYCSYFKLIQSFLSPCILSRLIPSFPISFRPFLLVTITFSLLIQNLTEYVVPGAWKHCNKTLLKIV